MTLTQIALVGEGHHAMPLHHNRRLTDSRTAPRAPLIVLKKSTPASLTEQHLPNAASWFPDVRDRIRSCLDLAPNWDSYGGEAISGPIVGAAERFAEFMAVFSFSRPSVCPQSSGGIMLEWHDPDRTLTVDIDSDDIKGFSFSYESAEAPELEGGTNEFTRLVQDGFLHDPF